MRLSLKKKMALLLAGMMIFLSGCSIGKSRSIHLDVTQKVTNLDPQFAQGTAAKLILSNTTEGLMRYDQNGEIICGMAQQYHISSGGLIYLFTLRDDLRWSNGDRITAADFVFTFQRLFYPDSPSPYAEKYLMIRGAEEAMNGKIPVESISVSAPNDRTVRIELSHPSASFLELLAEPAAAPCNESFFASTRARYGLDRTSLRSSGAFYISSWEVGQSMTLSRNPYYYDAEAVKSPAISIKFLSDESRASLRQRFENGSSDIYQAGMGESTESRRKISYFSEENRLWALTFQCENVYFSNRNIRRSFLQAIDRREIQTDERTPESFQPTDDFLPAAIRPEGIASIQDLPCDEELSRRSLEEGLKELGRGNLPSLTLMVPKSAGFDKYLDTQGRIPDNTGLGRFTGYLQKAWKDVLYQYVDIEVVEDEEFLSRVQQGKYQMAIVPFDAQGEGPGGILELFSSGNSGNLSRYHSEAFEKLLLDAAGAEEESKALQCYAQAEQLLLEDAAALPLFTQNTYYLTGAGISGVRLVNGTYSFRDAVYAD